MSEIISMGEALLVSLQGFLIVFLALIVLMVILYIMKLFAKDESVPAPAATPLQVPSSAPMVADNDETIAVISAAVAAMSGDDVTKRLRVVSIKRQGSQTPIWSAKK